MRADTEAFVAELPTLEVNGAPFLDPAAATIVARAPGRLDVMGGIADYSGSLVLQLPLDVATHVAVQRQERREIAVASFGATTRVFRIPFDACLGRRGEAVERTRAKCRGDEAWAGYVVGALAVLTDRCRLALKGGVRLAIRSDVPEGKGLSSSAALEVATMSAVAAHGGLDLDLAELARRAQEVEHEVVGAPCGIMDQMAVALGRESHLLALRCQPAEVLGHLPLPPGVAVWGIDSGVRHDVAGEDYGSVRTAAFMGYRILAAVHEMPTRVVAPGRVEIDDPHWHGYVANVAAEELSGELLPYLPVSMRGDEFLDRYAGITDDVTTVDPARRYRVRAATCHPIREHTRIRQFAKALTESGQLHHDSLPTVRVDAIDPANRGGVVPTPYPDERLRALGSWMGMSHAGYGDCGLGSPATDRIAELVRAAGPVRGLFGARITGGGSGGTVAILGRPDASDAIEEIAATLRRETGKDHLVFAGSSPGVTVHRY